MKDYENLYRGRFVATPGEFIEFSAFQKSVERVESPIKKLVANRETLDSIFAFAVAAGDVIDWFKKQVVYQKPDAGVTLRNKVANARFAIRELSDNLCVEHAYGTEEINDLNLRLLHAAIGKFGEGAELIAACRKQLNTGVLDKTNVEEELGDDAWYTALAVLAIDGDYASILGRNTAKLDIRYPTAQFRLQDTENRDLTAERLALEGRDHPVAEEN